MVRVWEGGREAGAGSPNWSSGTLSAYRCSHIDFVNTLTGGEAITARHLHQASFEFHPQLKLFLAANNKPRMPSSPQSGIWRRLRLVPFDHTPDKPDPDLKKRLATDDARAAILAWAVEGLRIWQEEGLGEVPSEITAANKEYKEESDPYSAFIEECVEYVKGSKTTLSEMYEVHVRWADLNRRTPAQKGTLGRILEERGFVQGKKDVQASASASGKRTSTRAWLNVEVTRPASPIRVKEKR